MELYSNSEAEKILNAADLAKAQSFLLEGPQGVGKKESALSFACKVLGNETRVRQGSHPDFLMIERRVDEKTGKQKTEIIAEDARKISDFLSLTPAEGNHRICIIDSADALNIAAANSILKTLEEPSTRSIIILLAHGGHILPTIRSRCMCIKFGALSQEEMLEYISSQMPDLDYNDKELLFTISESSLGMANLLLENDGLNVSRETFAVFSNFPNLDYKKINTDLASALKYKQGWECYKAILNWVILNIARGVAKDTSFSVEGHNLTANLSNFQAFLEAETTYRKDIQNAETFNLDKKQVLLDTLKRFSACYR